MKAQYPCCLPAAQVARIQRIRLAFQQQTSPTVFKAKRLNRRCDITSIPLGRRWRAIFIEKFGRYQFKACLSHETYNKVINRM
jgi:hypothetical protein